MRQTTRTLYCSNGCGHHHNIGAIEMPDVDVKSITLELECPECEEVMEYIEDLTVTITFSCTGCDTTKEANTKPTRGMAKTEHYCGECGRKTVWHETGWEHIEVV